MDFEKFEVDPKAKSASALLPVKFGSIRAFWCAKARKRNPKSYIGSWAKSGISVDEKIMKTCSKTCLESLGAIWRESEAKRAKTNKNENGNEKAENLAKS